MIIIPPNGKSIKKIYKSNTDKMQNTYTIKAFLFVVQE